MLFKNAVSLVTAAHIDVVVMAKTGTLTMGEPEVTDIIAASAESGLTEEDVLRLVAGVKRESEHPLAQAIVRHAEDRGLRSDRADRIENVPGHGAIAEVDGHRVVVGNRRLIEREGIDLGDLAGER
ncbi:MAG: HAD family hydrolase [Actinophytocola sp.]|uniref:HAD family hydrolase n=1 Tax=Actinophytocola sp. TaxID=1872138 RepID=UPI003D6A471F